MAEYVKVKYTGKEAISSMVDKGAAVEWKKGDVKDVLKSKVKNHLKYPFFELNTGKKAVVKKAKKVEPKAIVPEVVESSDES